MPSFTSKTLLTAVAGAASVAAHGHVNNIVINGVSYQGYDPTSFPYMSNPPTVVGWTASDTDNGFVAPDSFGSADIICHKSATNAGGHAVVAAGDKVFIQWNTWPESHHGPVIDYLANCGTAGCESVDKTTLEFFKIDEVGLVDDSVVPGTWGSDQLIANNNSWLVEIPPTIAPGFYVLRHEIIALHSAGSTNGAQNYPQCFNLQVTGGGSDAPAGTLGESLYTETDAGILVNIYQSLSTYDIPGPTLISGAVSVSQTSSVITASASAVTGSAAAAAAAVATSVAAATTSAAVAETTSAAAAAADDAADSSSTTTTTTAAAAVSTSAAAAASTQTQTPKPKAGGGCGGGAAAKQRQHPRDLAIIN
ncbi:glycoside hydrolase [Diplogelasinospora grovesii]|uniref:lytic cellulose monooxygenase (C4-dehydrogenating) n=1 Tax=Diplogelasinospora grovesii TaxID=303347 RepID=A0AAN6NHA3_9PEZI|nr:glycoside hydrolase [Diplogelasinospora grovesii]